MFHKVKIPVVILLCLATLSAFSLFTAPHAQARTLTPNTCSYWSTDVQSIYPLVGKDLAGHPITYTWNLSIGSLRVCGSGQYEGWVADEICLTVPPRSGWPALNLYNEWYTDGHFINQNNYNFPISQTQSTTRCQFSGGWPVASGHQASIIAFNYAFDGSHPAGLGQSLYDYPS